MAVNYQYPNYVEKPSLTANVYQKGEDIQWGDKAAIVTRSYIGPDDSILNYAYTNKIGSGYDCEHGLSGRVESCRTLKIDADRSQCTLVVNCPYDSGDNPDEALNTTWACNMAQLELPLYKYCTPNYTSSDLSTWGDAAAIEAWEHEDNPTLKTNYHYTVFDTQTQETTEKELEGRSLEIAKMMNSGVDNRICFYPQATRVTRWASLSDVQGEGTSLKDREAELNLKDTQPLSSDLTAFLTVENYSWLKSGYDIQQNTDGSWSLTESWIGTPTYLGEWNNALYSKDDNVRWKMWKDEQNA